MNSKLEQLKTMTTVVADTGDIEAIRQWRPEDATTNPSLLLKAAASEAYRPMLEKAVAHAAQHGGSDAEQLTVATDMLAVLAGKEILGLIPGVVSTEVDARLSFDTSATLERARRLVDFYDRLGVDTNRVLIKIASTWEGIRAAEQLEKEKNFLTEQALQEGKPPEIVEKMIVGRMRKYLAEITLVGQAFVKDPDMTVGKLLKDSGATVASFVRIEVGEGIEKKEEDFAAEVEAQVRASQ